MLLSLDPLSEASAKATDLRDSGFSCLDAISFSTQPFPYQFIEFYPKVQLSNDEQLSRSDEANLPVPVFLFPVTPDHPQF